MYCNWGKMINNDSVSLSMYFVYGSWGKDDKQ